MCICVYVYVCVYKCVDICVNICVYMYYTLCTDIYIHKMPTCMRLGNPLVHGVSHRQPEATGAYVYFCRHRVKLQC